MESEPQLETSKQSSSGTQFHETNENLIIGSSIASNNGSFVNGEELDDEKSIGDGEIDTFASCSSSGLPVAESLKPVAKVTEDGDDDDDDDDDDDNEVFSGEVGGGMDVSEEAPRVRVSAEDGDSEDDEFTEALEEPDDDGKREGEYGEVEGVGVNVDSGVIEESANEGDAVVNVGEGHALVGIGDEKQDSSQSVATGDREEKVLSEFEGTEERTSFVEELPLGDSASVEGAGVKETDDGDVVVDSIQIDAGEAVRSGVAVVGDMKESDDLGNPLIEDSASKVQVKLAEVDFNSDQEKATGEGDPEVKGTEERTSVVEQPSLEDSAPVEGAAVKLTDEGDAVVDSVHIDVAEAVRSGVAVVGDVEESKGSEDSIIDGVNAEAEAEAAISDVAIVGGPESKIEVKEEPLVSETSSKVVDGADEQNEEAVVDTEENNSKADESKQHVPGDAVQTLSQEKGEEAGEKLYVPQELDGVSDGYGDDGEADLSKGEVASRDLAEALASGDRPEMIDGGVVTDSEEEEADSDEEGEGEDRELIDSTALAALLKAATSSGGSESGTITITSQDGSRLFSVERPAGLGTSLRSVRPTSNSSIFAPPNVAAPTEESLSEEDKMKLQKIHDLRVKFLRLVQRLGQTADQSVAAQVLYKLAILAGRTTFPSFSLDNAKQKAAQLEAEGKDDLDFSLNILVLGKTGVGKSATINSIFGEEKVKINAFEPETTSINLVSGIVDGVKLRVIDAPGLRTSAAEQGFNRNVLASVKKYIQKFPPDLMLYMDRLDSKTRDLNDLPILRTITSSLGTSIWRSAVLTLTHAACAPPDGPSGTPLGYEVFVGQRSHIIQQSIGQAVGDLRFMNLSMMNPVSLVENHPACRKNRDGQKVLPNGQAWRPQLLLLCYSLKILAEASLTSKPQDTVDHRKLFGFRVRSPPLPYLLSSLLQPRTHPKLSADQGGDNGDSDIDLDDLSDTDQEEEDEYDQLPPFKPLKKSQIAKLSREQIKAYYDEYDYRVKLLQKKQWRDELKRMREMKKNGKSSLNESIEMPEDNDGDNGAPAAVPVPLPDMVLPPSFDSDSPAYRYRFLEPTSQFLARPVLDTHGWDHDCGYDGVNVEQSLGIAGRYPAAVTVQVTKDKKDFNIHLDSAVSAKHGENGSSLVGFDVQTIGKQLAYIVRGESKFKTMERNKTTGGVSVTFLGENVAPGVKLDHQIALGKRLVLVGTAGTVRSQKDAAYGTNLEIRLKDADYPIGQDQSSFLLSLMKWRGDLAIGGNLQSQFSVGRSSKMAVRVALNNKNSGQISVKTNSSDNLALAYVGLVPIVLSIFRKFRPSPSENYTIY